MSFYLRKALGLGPLRVNVSKSGLGFSVGVKGARIGVTPTGQAYLHAGRGGFYFRQNLNTPPRAHDASASPAPDADAASVEVIESAQSARLSDPSQTELVEALQRVRRRVSRVAVVLAAAVAAAGIGIALGASDVIRLSPLGWTAVAFALIGAIVMGLIRADESDKRNGTVHLTFDVEPDVGLRITALRAALTELIRCQRVWSVETRQRTADWKRNAGVSTLVTRRRVIASDQLPRGVLCDKPVTALPAGRQTLYFFPFGLVAYDSSGVAVIPYDWLNVESGVVAFTVDDQPPTDARVVGHSWRYVNKNGGPDRRFSNNRQLPIAEYGVVRLTTRTGLNELFHTSRASAAKSLHTAIQEMPVVTSQIRRTH